MNSDRRHELQQNELAIYLGRINRSIEPYSRIIAVVVGVVFVGALALGVYNSMSSGEQSDATLQLLQASSSQDAVVLAEVSERYPDTAAGAWALLYQGTEYLAEGMRALYSGGAAEDILEQAIEAFGKAIQASDNRLLQSRAHFGIARAEESLGNIDAAIAAYNECIAVNESEAMIKRAQDRIDSLSSPETKEFLAWFGDQDFSPADPSLPPSLPGGTSLPDLPDLTLPPIGGNVGEERDLDEGLAMPDTTATEGESESSEAATESSEAANDGAEAASGDDASGEAPQTESSPTTGDAETTDEVTPEADQ